MDSTTPRGWGGSRNKADRESHELTAGQIDKLMMGMAHAHTLGLPFTRMITIHWQAAGIPLEGMSKATGHFIDLLSKALSRHGSSTSWIWVHENCHLDAARKGGHCHMLVHIPADLVPTIKKLQSGWLKRITGSTYKRGTIKSRPIGGLLNLENSNPPLYEDNLANAFAYLIKGAGFEAAHTHALNRLQYGGRIIGKRCGVSQNIGTSATNTPARALP